jgi:hypothetical protein
MGVDFPPFSLFRYTVTVWRFLITSDFEMGLEVGGNSRFAE